MSGFEGLCQTKNDLLEATDSENQLQSKLLEQIAEELKTLRVQSQVNKICTFHNTACNDCIIILLVILVARGII